MIRHAGQLPGFSLDNTTFPDREIDVIVLTNVEHAGTQHSITRPIAALLTGEPLLGSEGTGYESGFGRHIAQRHDALRLLNAFLAERLDAGQTSDRFRRFLTPTHQDTIRALRSHGPIRQLLEIESFRREPLTTYAYQAQFDACTVRADLALIGDGRLDGIWLSPWDRL